MEERCETCRFWIDYDEFFGDIKIGGCRRYPPQITNDNDLEERFTFYELTFFPQTSSGEWCGEYQPKDNTNGNPPTAS